MLTWSCPTGEEWDAFLLRPSQSRDAEMVQHLDCCAICRVIVEDRRKELLSLDLDCEPLIPSGIFRLYLWTPDNAVNPPSARLAAQSDTQGEELPASVTLISPDKRLMMKAIRDGRTGDTWVHLLSDDPSLIRNVLVRPFGTDIEAITDETGRVNVGKVPWQESTTLNAEVRMPRATFTLNRVPKLADAGSEALLTSEAGDKIRVTLVEQGSSRQLEIEILQLAHSIENAPVRLAVKGATDAPLVVASGHAGKIRLPSDPESHPIQVFLFQ